MAYICKCVGRNSQSHSEWDLMNALNLLSNDWHVWMNREIRCEGVNREIDCVLYHHKEGLLVIECKDGQIHCEKNPEDGSIVWYQNERAMTPRNPVEQVATLTPPLHDHFKKEIKKGGIPCRVRIQWAVFFGDMDDVSNIPPIECPTHRILLKNDLSDPSQLEKRLLSILHTNERSRGGRSFPNDILDYENEKKLIDFLSGDDSVPVEQTLIMEDESRQPLTLIQQTIMESVCMNKKIKVMGAAGSGKTMLALCEAERLANWKHRVALVCYNELLAESLRKSVEKMNFEGGEVEVHVFADWAKKFARAAKIKCTQGSLNADAYYNDFLPKKFVEAQKLLRKNKSKKFYDDVIIDEGQDMMSSWIDSILGMLKDQDKGCIRFFYDPNQVLYNRDWERNSSVNEMPTMYLSRGYRSTQRILDWVYSQTSKKVEYYSRTPKGRAVKTIRYKSTDNLEEKLEEVREKLEKEGFDPSDILVVSLHSQRSSALGHVDNIHFAWSKTGDSLEPNIINIVSAHRIKGLDAPVVILVDHKPNLSNEMKNRLFVAATRAKSRLIVLSEVK